MKRLLSLVVVGLAFFFTGCFEKTQEVTLAENGSGTFSNTIDMSAMIGMLTQMGGDDIKKMAAEPVDTTIALSSMADSVENISPQEKALMNKGTMHLKMNIKESKFITVLTFPFDKPADIGLCDELSRKVTSEALKKQMGALSAGMTDAPEITTIDDYYKSSFSNGLFTKTVIKSKYDSVSNDEFLKSMKESAGMGLPMSVTCVFNFAKPVKKAEGKNVELSTDKKNVRIKSDINDFFDDPSKLEYRIEY